MLKIAVRITSGKSKKLRIVRWVKLDHCTSKIYKIVHICLMLEG